jgi:hypothetical protein
VEISSFQLFWEVWLVASDFKLMPNMGQDLGSRMFAARFFIEFILKLLRLFFVCLVLTSLASITPEKYTPCESAAYPQLYQSITPFYLLWNGQFNRRIRNRIREIPLC